MMGEHPKRSIGKSGAKGACGPADHWDRSPPTHKPPKHPCLTIRAGAIAELVGATHFL